MYYDRFDIAEAWYLWLSHHHTGQWSPEYARLSRLSAWFSPRGSLAYETLTDNGAAVYDALGER